MSTGRALGRLGLSTVPSCPTALPAGMPDLVETPEAGRKLVAVVHADMVGYSRLIGADDSQTFSRLRAMRRGLIDPLISKYDGKIVQTAGDSLLIIFDSIDGALRCAIEVQQQVPVYDGDHPPDRRIRFRVGVNIGDVIRDGVELHGDGLNVAARLQAASPPGGVCVSRAVREHARDRLGLTFDPMGELRLKNIARPVEAFTVRLDADRPIRGAALRRFGWQPRHWVAASAIAALIVGAVLEWTSLRPAQLARTALTFLQPSAREAPHLSIVVLPFANLSNNPEEDYFADAITGDLTTDLSRISGSVVIAHSTAMSYRGKAVDAKRIGQELDVRYMLEGSVRRMGDQVEVNAQLIDTGSAAHIWAERFTSDRRNLAEAQSRITGRLARTLNLELVEAAGRRIEQEKAVDPDADDLAMRGWALWFRPFSLDNRREALAAFERALEIDPRSVEARLGLATILVANMGAGSSRSPEQDGARAERLLLGVIEQDANSSRAHEVLGMLRRVQNRLDESRIEYEAAGELDRNNAHALLGLGETLMFRGDPADAIPRMESSARLDPRDPNAAFGDWALGTCQLLLGHLDEAVDLLRKARAENPRIYFFHIYLAGALGLRGDIDEARAALAEAIGLKPEVSSLARWSANQPWVGNPAFVKVRENTLDIGLRRAGMPDH